MRGRAPHLSRPSATGIRRLVARAAVALFLVVVAAGLCLASQDLRGERAEAAAPPGGATHVSLASRGAILWGARIGGSTYGRRYADAPYDPRTLARFEANAGKGVSIVVWGQSWYDHGVPQGFDPRLAEEVRAHGSIPMIDWSPWDLKNQGSASQPAFQLRDVIGGKYDAYISDWAAGAAAWGKPLFVRLCHEMNGSWYPWSERANGNRRGEFVRAWRHVVDLVRASGATNVTWIWAPNEFESYEGIPIRRLYPGDAYVDWLGISGFNWGNGQRGSLWRSFDKTFSRSYPRVRAISPGKPIMLAEIGSSERGGSKARWLRNAFSNRIPRMPSVRAVVYWNRADEGMDWPIETSRASRAAFRRAIASPLYSANVFSQVSASPIPPP
jgi:hypothetical protein